jgi:hypothetical protein
MTNNDTRLIPCAQQGAKDSVAKSVAVCGHLQITSADSRLHASAGGESSENTLGYRPNSLLHSNQHHGLKDIGDPLSLRRDLISA